MTIITSGFSIDTSQILSFGMLSDDSTRTFDGMVKDVSELGIFAYVSAKFSDAPFLSGIRTDVENHIGKAKTDRTFGWFRVSDRDKFGTKAD